VRLDVVLCHLFIKKLILQSKLLNKRRLCKG
jgi:hypothetical protein